MAEKKKAASAKGSVPMEENKKVDGVKYVYFFGDKSTEGDASMKNELGGKGANLAEMSRLGLPVPAGFTITTDCCTAYFAGNCTMPEDSEGEVDAALAKVEAVMGRKYGDPENPLLLSCRSGARQSMPGMMDTVLNIGLSSLTIPGLIKKTNNKRFVWDSYRRLIMMYADVVMEKAEGIEPMDGKGIRKILDEILDQYKYIKDYKSDTDLTADDLEVLADAFKRKIKEVLGVEFPDDPSSSFGAALAQSSSLGLAPRLSAIAGSRAFQTNGELPSTSRRWSSATWVILRRQALLSPETRPLAKTSSSANG
jgi:pyruvate,orthophosphate dikinase